METNEYALHLSDEDKQYLDHRAAQDQDNGNGNRLKEFCSFLVFKLKLIWKCINEPVLRTYYIFLLL